MRNSIASFAVAATAMACSGQELSNMSEAEKLELARVIIGPDAPPADPHSFCLDLYADSYFGEELRHVVWGMDSNYHPSTGREFHTKKRAVIPAEGSNVVVVCGYKKELPPDSPPVRYDMSEDDKVQAALSAILSRVEIVYFVFRDTEDNFVQGEFSDTDANGIFDGASTYPGNEDLFPRLRYNMQERYRQIVDEAAHRLETNDLLPGEDYLYRAKRR